MCRQEVGACIIKFSMVGQFSVCMQRFVGFYNDADHCIAEGAETLIDTPEDGQIGRNM
jgi:hypothetical protein